MDRCQREFLLEQMKQLTPQDFEYTLNYYNIPVKKKSILCIYHNDRHYGSCMIMKNNKAAFCYVCGKKIDPVDIVMHNEGLQFLDAAEKLWTTILGNSLPESNDREKKPLITYKELEFIGIKGSVSVAEEYINLAPRMDPEGRDSNTMAYNGIAVVKKHTMVPSFMKMLEQDRACGIAILKGKADETVRYYEKLLDEIKNQCSDWDELVSQCEANLRRAIAIRKKLSTAI